jgi:hypothetical protein
LILTNAAAGTYTWTDDHALASVTQRYYSVVANCGLSAYTNTMRYAMITRAEQAPCSWSLVGVPVDLAPDNTFDGELGRQLAAFLTAAARSEDCSDQAYVVQNGAWREFSLTALPGATNWWDFARDGVADVAVNATAAFWVKRRCPAALPAAITWTGRAYTNAPAIHYSNTDNGWSLFSWPLPTPGRHRNLGQATPRDQLGFEAAGAKGGKTGAAGKADGDELWIWTGTEWRHFWLIGIGNANYDGRWWDDSTGRFADFELQPGSGYYYRHRGSGFNWTPHP